jgi:hypothetical protein
VYFKIFLLSLFFVVATTQSHAQSCRHIFNSEARDIRKVYPGFSGSIPKQFIRRALPLVANEQEGNSCGPNAASQLMQFFKDYDLAFIGRNNTDQYANSRLRRLEMYFHKVMKTNLNADLSKGEYATTPDNVVRGLREFFKKSNVPADVYMIGPEAFDAPPGLTVQDMRQPLKPEYIAAAVKNGYGVLIHRASLWYDKDIKQFRSISGHWRGVYGFEINPKNRTIHDGLWDPGDIRDPEDVKYDGKVALRLKVFDSNWVEKGDEGSGYIPAKFAYIDRKHPFPYPDNLILREDETSPAFVHPDTDKAVKPPPHQVVVLRAMVFVKPKN